MGDQSQKNKNLQKKNQQSKPQGDDRNSQIHVNQNNSNANSQNANNTNTYNNQSYLPSSTNFEEKTRKLSAQQTYTKSIVNLTSFNPNFGVTLYYDQNVKEGPKYKESIANLEDLEYRLKQLSVGEPLQISRSEYRKIVEKGNLNMGQALKQGAKQAPPYSSTPNLMASQINPLNNSSNQDSQINILNSFVQPKTQKAATKNKGSATRMSKIEVVKPLISKNILVSQEEEEAWQKNI